MNRKITDTSKTRGFSTFYTTLNAKEGCPFKRLMNTWLDCCQADGLSPQTILDYSDKMGRFYWWYITHSKLADTLGQHPKNITTLEARQFAAYLRESLKSRWGMASAKEQLSPASIAAYGRTVKAFFSWLEEEGYIEQNPFNKSVKFSNRRTQDRAVKNVSAEKLTLIFTALSNPSQVKTFAGCRDLAMVSLLLDSGMRRGELLSMRLCDFDISRMCSTVRGKTGPRTTHFSERCKGVLLDYLKMRREKGGDNESETNALWLNIDGDTFSIHGFEAMIQRLEKRSGVDFHAHQLRHTFALMMSNKVSVFELRDLMGHSSITTTQIYVQQNPSLLADAYRPNSPLTTLESGLPGLKRRGRPRKGH